MTELLEKAISTLRSVPAERQDDVARLVLALAGDDAAVLQLTAEEEADLDEAQAEMERGEFATEQEVEAVFAKYRA